MTPLFTFLQSFSDKAALERAKKLASSLSWKALQGNQDLVWGQCKSSGASYYKTALKTQGPVFTCNCPSRKKPCKHALALGLLLIAQPDAFHITDEYPEWIQQWAEKGAASSDTANSELEEKRQAERQKNFSKRLLQMEAGLNELETWLQDTLRLGLASLEQQPYSFWQEIAARMVDAKLGGIGKRIRQMQFLVGSQDNWPEKVASELGNYQLFLKGMRRMEQLPLNVQQDLLTYAGVTTRKETLFEHGQLVRDYWMVLGKVEGIEDNLNFRRTWLLGWNTKRYALVLEYVFGNVDFPRDFIPGEVYDAKVVYYPSNAPLRVAVQECMKLEKQVKRIVGFEGIDSFLEHFAAILGRNPLIPEYPCSIEEVIPTIDKGQLVLLDRHQKVIPIVPNYPKKYELLAMSGGYPVNAFGEWTGHQIIPLSVTSNERLVFLY